MENDKKSRVRAFNVDAYLAFFEGYFEHLERKEAQKAAEISEALKKWDKFKAQIERDGKPKKGRKFEPLPKTEPLPIAEFYDERAFYYQVTKREPLPFEDLQLLKISVPKLVESDFSKVETQCGFGIIEPKTVLENELSKALGLIDDEFLARASAYLLVEKDEFGKALSTLCAVGVAQRIIDAIEAADKRAPTEKPTAAPLPKLKWTGQKNTLTRLYGELRRKGFLDNNPTEIAEILVRVFENVGTTKHIEKELTKTDLPQKQGWHIEAIISDLVEMELLADKKTSEK